MGTSRLLRIRLNPNLIYTGLFHIHFSPRDQICASLIKSWPEPLRCWSFYSILTEVFPFSKNHIHSFNPKTNFLETVLNKTGEKHVKWWFSQGNFKNRNILLTTLLKEVRVVFFSYAFAFSDCNSTENVLKTMSYYGNIVGKTNIFPYYGNWIRI